MSNKSSGTGFECDFAEYMAEKGYWAHVFQNNRNGQPFDIILAKDGNTQAGDCKVCENDVFRLSPYGTQSDQCNDTLGGMRE